MDPSLSPLLALFSTLEYEEKGGLSLQSVEWSGHDVRLRLVVLPGDGSEQRWWLRCDAVRDYRIRANSCDCLQFETSHPVLLPYNVPFVELYIHGRPVDPDATVGRLIEAHRTVIGDWFDYARFFNLGPNRSLRGLLAGGLGRLAVGPQPVMEAYGRVLSEDGVRVSSPPSRWPVWWDGARWVEERQPLFAVLLGGSYFVTPRVVAERE